MDLTENQKRILAQVCMNSSINAGNALKLMINKDVKVNFPDVNLIVLPVKSIDEDAITGISDISGDLSGSIVVSYPVEIGLRLIDMVMMQPADTLKEVTADAKSAFTEFINIVGGAFLTNLANDLKFNVFPNPPIYVEDSGSIKKSIISQFESSSKEVFFVNTSLTIEGEHVGGSMFIVFDSSSLDKIMTVLK